MNWRKEIDLDEQKSRDNRILALIAFTMIGLIFYQPLAFLIVGLFVAYEVMNRLYSRQLESSLSIQNPVQTIRLFPGETTSFTIDIHNKILFPLANGKLEFQLNSPVTVQPPFTRDQRDVLNYSLPVSFKGKGKTTIDMNILAETRGTARLFEMKYRFPHLFDFETVTLRHMVDFHTEWIVMPRLLPVKGLEEVVQMQAGQGRSNLSPFEDVQSHLGTRDYHYSDPFYRINWKSTAKSQRLQTNVYEKVVDVSYMLIVNISSETLEDTLSHTAFLCRELTLKGYPFEMYLNIRRHGTVPVLHVPAGEGHQHYVKALETLARVQKMMGTVPFPTLLNYIGKLPIRPSAMILIGDVKDETVQAIGAWRYRQKNIFQVVSLGGDAALLPVRKEVLQHVT